MYGYVERSVSLRAWEIRDIAPFRSLPRDQRAAVAGSAEVRTYCHAEQLFHAGERCTEVTILLDGFVRLFRTNLDETQVTTAIVSPQSLLTMAILRDCATHDAHAEAIGHVRTVEIPGGTFLDLMSRYVAFSEEVASRLIARTDDMYMDMAADVHEQLSGRILYTLRRLARSTRGGSGEGTVVPLAYRLSHREIARLVGTNRSSVTRMLRVLEEQELVRLERGHVSGVRP